MRKSTTSLLAALLLVLAAVTPAQGQSKSVQFIRDAEVERIIRSYAAPLFHAAGLNPNDIDVYLINDRSLNAFVTSGLNMFIHTGLLIRAEDPLQVIGVIAHETGHLAGGHTATRVDSMRRSTASVIASYVVGLAAAIASGRPEVGQAVIAGGQDIALKNLLSYTRSQEAAADQAAVRLLNGTGQSPRGLMEFMRILGGQETLLYANQNPYLRSHPLTQDRVSFLEYQLRASPYANTPANPGFVIQHNRMRAKLVGFLEPMNAVLQNYPTGDDSVPARYARAIATYRQGEIESALEQIDALIAADPEDPYFHELKGQVLFENGRLAEALPAYQDAADRLPDSPLIRLALAQTQIEMNDPVYDQKALGNLTETLRREPNNSFAWRLTAIAHGRQGDVGLTALALAESALARGKVGEALEQARRAQRILPSDSTAWLRAADIERAANRRARKR